MRHVVKAVTERERMRPSGDRKRKPSRAVVAVRGSGGGGGGSCDKLQLYLLQCEGLVQGLLME